MLTIDEIRARMKAANIDIAEDRLEMVRVLLSHALGPVRAMDSGDVRPLEPAVTFEARP
jgi:hypothetical protein